MEIYNTEEQQVEAIKNWWRTNGTAVLLGAVIGLGGLYGWRYYQSSLLNNQEEYSQAYHQVMNALASQEKEALNEAGSFIENNEHHYANLLALQLAKSYVDNNELNKAAALLRDVQQKGDSVLNALATVRLSRIETELGNFDTALSELDKVSTSSWSAQVEELRGDIKLRQGDKSAAAVAYTASIAAQSNPIVQMKLDNISK